MEQTEIHQVRIDRCSKHGVWFDRDELQHALHRVGQDGMAAAPVAAPLAIIEAAEVLVPIEREIVEPSQPLAPTNPPSAPNTTETRPATSPASTAMAEKMWTTFGPNSGGIAGWLLFQHHMFYFTDEGHAGSIDAGIPVAAWIARYRDEHPDIASDLVARGNPAEA